VESGSAASIDLFALARASFDRSPSSSHRWLLRPVGRQKAPSQASRSNRSPRSRRRRARQARRGPRACRRSARQAARADRLAGIGHADGARLLMPGKPVADELCWPSSRNGPSPMPKMNGARPAATRGPVAAAVRPQNTDPDRHCEREDVSSGRSGRRQKPPTKQKQRIPDEKSY